MSDLISLVEKARQRKASGLLFQSGQPAYLQFVGPSLPLGPELHTAEELLHLLEDFLNPREKSSLKEKGFLNSSRPMHSGALRFQILGAKEDLVISLQWRNLHAEDQNRWEVPPMFLTQANKEGGINLVIGPPSSGRTAFLSRFCRDLLRDHRVGAVLFSDDHDLEAMPGLTRHSVRMLESVVGDWYFPKTVIVDTSDPRHIQSVIGLAERGINVFFTMSGADTVSCIRRIHGWADKGTYDRLLSHLQSAVAVRLIAGLDGIPQAATEMVLFHSRLRTALLAGQFDEAQADMKREGDKTGIRTLNQSLMSLLLKRKIDLKSGFSASLYPDELDEMLKKVGI